MADNNRDGFIIALCKNDNFASCLPWTITLSIVITSITFGVAYYNVNITNAITEQMNIKLESEKLELEKFKSFTDKERLVYIMKDKTAVEIDFLTRK